MSKNQPSLNILKTKIASVTLVNTTKNQPS